MFSEEHDSRQSEVIEQDSVEQAALVGSESVTSRASGEAKSSAISHQPESRAQVVFEKLPADYSVERQASASGNVDTRGRRRLNARWWIFAVGSALLLVILGAAGIYLLTKQPSTVDNIVITTVPSGADIKLDANGYGLSPVKLEQLEKGTYTLTITKDGFEPVVEQITLLESQKLLEFKLRPIPPPELSGLSFEDQIRSHQNNLEKALARGQYGIPYPESAHYYAVLILSIDPNNEYALKKLEEIRAIAQRMSKESIARGDLAQSQLIIHFIRNYYGQPQDMARRYEQYADAGQKIEEPVEPDNTSNAVRQNHDDPNYRREQGLAKYRYGQYADAIGDLQFAILYNRGTTDVIFSLADSYRRTGQYGKAEEYFNQVPASDDDSYRSTIAALGDIASRRGDTAKALEKYKHARQLGGSLLYTTQMLDERIERIERRQQEQAAEPVPATVQVRHQHGSLRGSCRGTLSVSENGVRYEGSEHQFSWNLLSVGVRVKGDEATILVSGKSEKFKADGTLVERFRESVSHYQRQYAPSN